MWRRRRRQEQNVADRLRVETRLAQEPPLVVGLVEVQQRDGRVVVLRRRKRSERASLRCDSYVDRDERRVGRELHAHERSDGQAEAVQLAEHARLKHHQRSTGQATREMPAVGREGQGSDSRRLDDVDVAGRAATLHQLQSALDQLPFGHEVDEEDATSAGGAADEVVARRVHFDGSERVVGAERDSPELHAWHVG